MAARNSAADAPAQSPPAAQPGTGPPGGTAQGRPQRADGPGAKAAAAAGASGEAASGRADERADAWTLGQVGGPMAGPAAGPGAEAGAGETQARIGRNARDRPDAPSDDRAHGWTGRPSHARAAGLAHDRAEAVARRAAAGLHRLGAALVEVVYPGQCALCDARVEQHGALCGPCWREMPFITGLACDRCGAPLPGADPGHAVLCDECLRTPRPWSHGRAALLYRDHARRLILPLKHGDRTQLARPAARWMAQAAGPLLDPGTLLVPVPLHWSRLLARRYSQSALLAQQLARLSGADLALQALLRSRRTAMLDGVGRAGRFAALDGAIRPHPRHGARLAGRRVLLIDDVMTSGATLAACAQAARAGGAAGVSVLVLARVARDA